MKAAIGSDKPYRSAIPAFAVLLAVFLACAQGPSAPVDDNSAPVIDSLRAGGSKPVIAEGTIGLDLHAHAYDIDGDDLSFTWSGPGVWRNQNDAQKTVLWDVPADTSGLLEVTCTASDGKAQKSRTRAFSVGRSLDGDDFGPVVGDQVRWTREDSPFYVMTADITIPDSYELYVGKGCRIFCERDRTLLVQGGLIIDGGPGGDQVIFKPYGSTSLLNWWKGIAFESSADTLDVERAIIRNAEHGLYMNLGVPLGARIRYSTFENCKKGILARSTPLTLDVVHFSGGETGLDLGACELEMSGCNFVDLEDAGMVVFNECEGLSTGSIFDGQSTQSVSLSGDSFVDFHENSFLGTNTAFLLGGFSPGSNLDFTCNYWGPGVTLGDILLRIEGWTDLTVQLEPFKMEPGAACSWK